MPDDQADGGLHNDQTVADQHSDQTDGNCIMINDLHDDHTLKFKFYIWEYLKLKSKLK